MYAPGAFPEGYLEKCKERIEEQERYDATGERPKPDTRFYEFLRSFASVNSGSKTTGTIS
jgi:hypothetical protein